MAKATTKVALRLDEDLFLAVSSYSAAAGHASVSETLRQLISDGLMHRTEKPYASLVREQVHEEMESFMNGIDRALSYRFDEELIALDDSLYAKMRETAAWARAAAVAAALAADPDDPQGLLDRALDESEE